MMLSDNGSEAVCPCDMFLVLLIQSRNDLLVIWIGLIVSI